MRSTGDFYQRVTVFNSCFKSWRIWLQQNRFITIVFLFSFCVVIVELLTNFLFVSRQHKKKKLLFICYYCLSDVITLFIECMERRDKFCSIDQLFNNDYYNKVLKKQDYKFFLFFFFYKEVMEVRMPEPTRTTNKQIPFSI